MRPKHLILRICLAAAVFVGSSLVILPILTAIANCGTCR
jgi:hypothetical protein